MSEDSDNTWRRKLGAYDGGQTRKERRYSENVDVASNLGLAPDLQDVIPMKRAGGSVLLCAFPYDKGVLERIDEENDKLTYVEHLLDQN